MRSDGARVHLPVLLILPRGDRRVRVVLALLETLPVVAAVARLGDVREDRVLLYRQHRVRVRLHGRACARDKQAVSMVLSSYKHDYVHVFVARQ